MDENFEFHKSLNGLISNKLINEELFEKVAKNYAVVLKAKNIKRHIENILEKRNKDFFDFIKKYNRSKQRDLVDLNRPDFGYAEFYNIEQKNTEELEILLSNLKKIELSENEISILKTLPKDECSPYLLKIIKEFKCNNIVELLEKIYLIDIRELVKNNNFDYYLGKSAKFKKRKIKELISYRNAQTTSMKIDLEKFILDTHELVDKKESFRNHHISFGGPLNGIDGIHPKILKRAMKYFLKKISSEKTNLDINSSEKLAMKYYLFFEVIHPFEDGNGRTGRALFTYLARKFSEKNNEKLFNYPYIPIARNESGSVFDSDGMYTELGSLAIEFSNKMAPILRNKKMRALMNRQESFIFNKKSQDLFYNIWKEINKNNEDKIDDLIEIRKRLTQKDSLDGEDFKKIANEIKKQIMFLKKQRKNNTKLSSHKQHCN